MLRILTLFLLISTSAFAQGRFRISGEVQNPTERKAILVLYRDWISDEEEYELTLNSDNRFSFVTTLKGVAYIDLYYADQGFHFWIAEPNDEVTLKFDPAKFWQTLQVTGQGSEKGLYYTEHQNKFEKANDWETQVDKWKKEPLKSFFKKLDDEQSRQLAFLENYQNLSQDFRDTRKADIIGAIQNHKIEALSGSKYVSWSVDSIRNTLKTNDVPLAAQAASLEYGNVFMNLADLYIAREAVKRKKELTEPEEYHFIKSLYTKKRLSRELTERLLGSKIKNAVNANGLTPKIVAVAYDYLAFVQNKGFKNSINQLVYLQQTLTKGAPAKPFTLKDADGNTVSLDSYKGKVVYLDFWTSWCGPCIHDMQFADKIKSHFQSKDVVFIQISLDDEAEWKEALEMYKVKGVNVRTDDNSPLLKNYGISGVPTYFLIDKKGNFALTKVADPSENDGKTLIKQIEEALALKE